MKKIICIFLCIILIFSFLGCKKTPTKIKSEITEYTMTKGVNLSALEDRTKPHKFLDKDQTYAEIFEKGFDHVRIPVDFRLYCDENGITKAFYQRLDNIIRMANDNGLLVMLDFHGWYDFNVSSGDDVLFTKIWKDLAEHYKDYPKDRLFFELINEPHTTEGGDLDERNLWNLQNSVIGEIRKIDSLRTIVVAMPEWNGPWTLENYKNYNYDNLIFALHTYAPLDFTHQGQAWAGKGDIKLSLTDEMLQELYQQLESITRFTVLTNNKVILNEFGLTTTGHISDEDVDRYLSYIASYTKKRNIPWTYWAYSGSFGVYDTGFLGIGAGWRQNVLDALMK